MVHPLYPEPGARVAEPYTGMPRLSPPDPLPRDRKLSAIRLRDDYVAYEGLGFCIYSYIPSERIADPKLAALWRKARESLQAVVEYLENPLQVATRPIKIRKPLKLVSRR